MPHNACISLGGHFAEFVDRQVHAGRYSTASEMIHAGLRLLEEREAAFQALRDAIDLGEQSGPAVAFDFDAFLERKRRGAAA